MSVFAFLRLQADFSFVRIIYFMFECDANSIILVQYYVSIVILEEIPKNTAYQVNILNAQTISFNIQNYLSNSSNNKLIYRVTMPNIIGLVCQVYID